MTKIVRIVEIDSKRKRDPEMEWALREILEEDGIVPSDEPKNSAPATRY